MRTRRILPLIAVASLALGPTTPASAATKSDLKVEGINWFWESQSYVKPSDVHGQTCPSTAPACPDPQRNLPNPHEEGALPVQVMQGKDEKISAIQWDFDFLKGDKIKITSFKFTIIESKDPRDQSQTVNTTNPDKIIQACKITDTWSGSEDGADRMEDKPDHTCANAIDGKRKGTATTGFFWEFDVTKIASSWTAATKAYGVMLVGKKPKDSSESWQIVLKGPRRNDETTAANEAAANAKNIKATITYTRIASSSSSGTTGGYTGGTSSTGGFGFGTDYTPSTSTAPETDFTGSFPTTPAVPAMNAPTTGAPGASSASSTRPEDPAGLPPIFWLALPLSLLALSLVRNIVLSPAGGKRPDGVVALIRNHNAARLGRAPRPDARSPLSGVTRALQSAGGRVRGLVRRAITGGAA